MTMPPEADRKPVSPLLGTWMAVGVAIGAALGAATKNFGLWIPIGLAVGLALGVGMSKKRGA
ncbi:MAG TPA: hypothetical protein VGS03_10975 [Candidatus Polarisedimenticolia bacterium]|jgi:uncharacterized membrane protein YoaK (UPF0700 family)|nr:hypothetical protein [Candidatus Polarisedimenticolia bacterium]